MAFVQRLGPEVYEKVQLDIRAGMAAAGIDMLLLDAADDVLYTTGFASRPNEWPTALALTAQSAFLLIPELERDYALRQTVAADSVVYFEFPGVDRPFDVLAGHRGRTGKPYRLSPKLRGHRARMPSLNRRTPFSERG